jgi:FkbM family methyltransferase
MTFISYAQNFEDVMLWRALKNIDQGFYIDVGAQDPVVDSVSLAFYERGWRGVHIEPTQQYSTKLREARPDEIGEQVAIGSSEGLLAFYELNDTGLSTADPEIAKRHQDAGYSAVQTAVQVMSLDAILDRYAHKPVHWLKLDVEGLERSVLESWRTSACRPWILVIESTKPTTQEQSHADWESLVVEKGYSFAYFDGLNRFYVHRDHHELLVSFSAPPNIFDGFVLSGSASQSFYQLVADIALQAEARATQAEALIVVMQNSTSWRLTLPLRWVVEKLRVLRDKRS